MKFGEDTKTILALIYRDYMVPDDERKRLLIEENNIKIQKEKELREKYNLDNLFKNRYSELPKEISNNMQLIEVKQYPWYKRLYQKILNLFGIAHK